MNQPLSSFESAPISSSCESFVDAVVDHRLLNGKYQVMIKWLDEKKENSWHDKKSTLNSLFPGFSLAWSRFQKSTNTCVVCSQLALRLHHGIRVCERCNWYYQKNRKSHDSSSLCFCSAYKTVIKCKTCRLNSCFAAGLPPALLQPSSSSESNKCMKNSVTHSTSLTESNRHVVVLQNQNIHSVTNFGSTWSLVREESVIWKGLLSFSYLPNSNAATSRVFYQLSIKGNENVAPFFMDASSLLTLQIFPLHLLKLIWEEDKDRDGFCFGGILTQTGISDSISALKDVLNDNFAAARFMNIKQTCIASSCILFSDSERKEPRFVYFNASLKSIDTLFKFLPSDY